MAQQVLVQLVDDLDGTATDDIETVRFGVDGMSYEIDLGPDNSAQLRNVLAEFVANARRAGGRAGRGTSVAGRAKPSATAHTKEQARAIREWAKANGRELAERGRIPAVVANAFDAAHS
ncbi:Lsr2 family protein [Umezawaea sp. Da 62-37]|uniref:histone-like nucleoid-structuring protein Lsr2 n=1 Tax=Umezawaea sp. Da 62-37 TaxID=3075927 RepID=UPI0028F6F398|nr:Lsr2 family protein [Umezawaea sp. Da 62-37]WNV85144.1 Lsr2 family protein [Umezawaea sp. Da 62-37]